MSAAIFHGTAAERDTILAALKVFNLIGQLNGSVSDADFRARVIAAFMDEPEKPTLENGGIDRLCERLSAPVADCVPIEHYEKAVSHWLEWGEKTFNTLRSHQGYFAPGGWAYETLKKGPPQAPEPVNAELLTIMHEALTGMYQEFCGDTRFPTGEARPDADAALSVARVAIARAESALAAQKSPPAKES